MIVTIGGIPVYDAIISDEQTGMFKISLVDDPAIMSDFQAFENMRKQVMYAIQDEEKRLVRGCIMRANFPIYRRDRNGEYYVIYKADQIRRMAEKYLLEGRQNNVNQMHLNDSDVDGVQMVQYFIKGDGVNVEGFEDISDGSLFGEFHVINDEVWSLIKDGTYKGFSLEGVFDLVPEQDRDEIEEIVDLLDGAFSQIFKQDKNMNRLERFKEALAKRLQEQQYGNVTTDRGILTWDGDEDLKEGDAVFVEDAEGNRNPAEDGEYVTADNKVIVVVEGKVAEIKDAEAEVAPENDVEVEETETKVEAGSVNTDKGVLAWNGEEDLKAGDEVFVEREGAMVPAEDGEYVTEDGKVIVVVEGKVAEIRDPEAEVAPAESEEMTSLKAENEALKAENEALKAENEALKRTPAAKPAHEEVSTSGEVKASGNKGLDRLSRILHA